MKLLNRSLQYLALSILIVVGTWSIIFYLNFRDEIYDIVDESLEDQLELLGDRVREDASLLETTNFKTGMYSISPITMDEVRIYQEEVYIDTLMPLPYDNDIEQVRLLTEAYEVNGEFYKFQAISSTVEEDDLIENLFWFIVWLYIALILTVVIVNNWALKKLWSPFYKLLNQLKHFRVDQDSGLPGISSQTTEFQELGKVADDLVDRTVQTYVNQKQFTENAAHELQTPVAIITSKLELLLEQGTLDENEAGKIAEVLDITTRLTQLNKSLLLLTRIENKQFVNNENISVNDLIRSLLRNLEDVSDFKNISIEVKENDNLFIYANAYLAEILFQNLMVNAINHNKPKGTVDVVVSSDSVTICNTSAVAILDEEYLYKRFSRNKKSQQGTGLGLAIVQAICKMYDFKINYSYNGQHCFTVTLK